MQIVICLIFNTFIFCGEMTEFSQLNFLYDLNLAQI